MSKLLQFMSENSVLPLYKRLYTALLTEIQEGHIAEGKRLPSKRALAQQLGLSRNTVETAYELLVAEGYIEPRQRSGYYVARLVQSFSPPKRIESEESAAVRSYIWDFSTNAVDTKLFPYSVWTRLMRELLSGRYELLSRGHRQGDLELRAALADFLAESRAVVCSPEQIIVGAGVELLLDLVCKLLPEDTIFGLENPGYTMPYLLLRSCGRTALPIELDSSGLSPEALERSGANVVYLTVAHQFPSGITMPAPRRAELLGWAASKTGRYIIEDDYDSDFRYGSRPLPALQGQDRHGRVIYIGTFSRTLAPSIRAAYLVLPPELLDRYRERTPYLSCSVSRFEQQVLARFLSEGYYSRHLRRCSRIYAGRQTELLNVLSELGGTVNGSQAGQHFVLRLPDYGEAELVARAANAGIRVHGLSEYDHTDKSETHSLVLGFAGIDSPREAGKALAEAIKGTSHNK